MGAAFENICLGPGVAYFPAVSLSQGESVRLNFGSTPFMYVHLSHSAVSAIHEGVTSMAMLFSSN